MIAFNSYPVATTSTRHAITARQRESAHDGGGHPSGPPIPDHGDPLTHTEVPYEPAVGRQAPMSVIVSNSSPSWTEDFQTIIDTAGLSP